MKHFVRAGAIAALMLSTFQAGAAPARAAPNAVVEAVQMPAWVERGGARIPAAPGMELRDNDRLRTGANSRLLLRMGEGSQVKLGENASLRLDSLAQQDENIFKAAMNVLEGAFRFTTDAVAAKRRREVNITVVTVTAGIRGTDLWGKGAPKREIVCLIEGAIEVSPPNEAPIVMDQALQFYVREDGKSKPVGKVDAEQLRQWATETEIAPGKGAARRGGKWKVIAASADTQEAALKLYDALRDNGYSAGIQPVRAGDKLVYNVRLANLPSRAEAEALAASLRGKMGVAEPKVSM